MILCILPSFTIVTAQTVYQNVSDQIPQAIPTGADTVDTDLVDVDGDGDLDIFIAEGTAGFQGRTNRLLINDGAGIFTDVSNSNLPFSPRPANSLSADFTDIDNDGDQDIVVANLGPTQLLLNDGNGKFTDASRSMLPAPPINIFDDISTEIAFVDVNQDGRLDIFVTNEIPPIPDIGPGGAQNFLYLQNQDGIFIDASLDRLPNIKNQSASFAFGDIDSDGDQDLIVANVGQNQVLINDGNGFFTTETALRISQQNTTSRAIILIDVDRDKDLDLIVANSNQEQNQVFINDSKGFFEESTQKALPVIKDTSSDVKTLDINFDGHPDLVFANSVPNPLGPVMGGHPLAPAPNLIYINNGRGIFTEATSEFLPTNEDISFDIEIGDVNGDRLQDILVSNANDGEEQLYVRELVPETKFDRIVPFATCVTQNSNGTMTATFGYINFNREAVYIPDGPRNELSIESDNIAELPPVIFLRGFVKEAFKVTFEQEVFWTVNSRTTFANQNTNPCHTNRIVRESKRELITGLKNYPNPFSEKTVIQYTLTEKSNVKIVLYNTFGNVIKTIVNSQLDKGKHRLELDANDLQLAPGVYFYEISSGTYKISKSLIVK